MRYLIVALLILGAGCSRHLGRPHTPPPAPQSTAWTVERDVAFTPVDWPERLFADVYRPEGPGPFPAVLLIHGGGWKAGDREQVEGLAKRIAARGYLVVNMTYRLVPRYLFPAQLEDVQQALRWMRSADGAARGIDGSHLVLCPINNW